MERKHGFNLGYFFVAMVLVGLFQLWLASRHIVEVGYSDLMRMVADGKISCAGKEKGTDPRAFAVKTCVFPMKSGGNRRSGSHEPT
ncbi:hypothetical protein HJB79_27755 [Rhizobium lentis]|uniref:hypothetical protein n=1 Tax=Rhizobium lentis TaxID=1138194 RepID=UPI001C834D63|nr:hypothetical protein [Rhizobium lentis]MBX5142515.1 hypothetical protein [Rhizobium lentis]MBX5179774.1 hypothetical protein [Rhizobium lentis]